MKRNDEWKTFASETKEQIHAMVNRLQENGDRLLYKHGEQLLDLRNETSKLYGVNFKYVNERDLGLPLDVILEYREEINNQPKIPLKTRVTEYCRRKVVWLQIKMDYVHNVDILNPINTIEHQLKNNTKQPFNKRYSKTYKCFKVRII